MRSGTTNTAFGMLSLIPLGLIAAGAVGWIMNLWKIVQALGANELTTMFVARCIGAFVVPIGAVLGFF